MLTGTDYEGVVLNPVLHIILDAIDHFLFDPTSDHLESAELCRRSSRI